MTWRLPISRRPYVCGLLKRYDEAIEAYDKALALKSPLAEAWFGRGNVLRELKRYDEAFAAYDQALTLKPNSAQAWLGRANTLVELTRHEEAAAAYEKALALNPEFYLSVGRLRKCVAEVRPR